MGRNCAPVDRWRRNNALRLPQCHKPVPLGNAGRFPLHDLWHFFLGTYLLTKNSDPHAMHIRLTRSFPEARLCADLQLLPQNLGLLMCPTTFPGFPHCRQSNSQLRFASTAMADFRCHSWPSGDPCHAAAAARADSGKSLRCSAL